MGAHDTGSVGVTGSSPVRSTSGKLPPPIIGGMRCYAKLHTTMAVFGFKAHASTKIIKRRTQVRLFIVLVDPRDRTRPHLCAAGATIPFLRLQNAVSPKTARDSCLASFSLRSIPLVFTENPNCLVTTVRIFYLYFNNLSLL